MHWFKFFKTRPPEIPQLPRPSPLDDSELARDLAETDKLQVQAERQAHTAAIASRDLRQVHLRNGFAPAIVDSVRRNLGEAL